MIGRFQYERSRRFSRDTGDTKVTSDASFGILGA